MILHFSFITAAILFLTGLFIPLTTVGQVSDLCIGLQRNPQSYLLERWWCCLRGNIPCLVLLMWRNVSFVQMYSDFVFVVLQYCR